MLGALVMLAVTVVRPPNFVVIFADDLGYGDLSCYGNREFQTPNLDRMAAEGVRFTNFYSASPGCSPSRAALLTGSYPVRVGVPQVLNPDSPTGLNPAEANLANVLKPLGYATACVGKWHLGVKNLMPTFQGFDTFYGLPYSNDMWPPNGASWPRLWLHKDREPVEEVKDLADQSELTGKYTRFATEFIRTNRDKPFLLYLAHSMPHVPIAVSKRFAGKTGKGLYADTIAELDWSVGEVLRALKANGLDANTLVFFASDNGPWLPYGDHAGSAGGFREGKGTSFEGGLRVPGIFRWPGRIPAGQVRDEIVTTMDVLPTVASLSGAKLSDVERDGADVSDLLQGSSRRSVRPWFFYFWPGELQAVRSGDWKLHVPHKHRNQTQPAGKGGRSAGEVTASIELSLFDLGQDPGETTNLAGTRPEVVARLMRMIAIGRRELGDTLTGSRGSGVRPPGRVEQP
ncbi:MAG: sulfatase [Methanoregulaceae archaeon]|nr:sulfatase [Methanoregulaceae archaeon]